MVTYSAVGLVDVPGEVLNWTLQWGGGGGEGEGGEGGGGEGGGGEGGGGEGGGGEGGVWHTASHIHSTVGDNKKVYVPYSYNNRGKDWTSPFHTIQFFHSTIQQLSQSQVHVHVSG